MTSDNTAQVQTIYPIIKTEQEVNDMIQENLSESRKKSIYEHIDRIRIEYDHYNKIKKRWTTVDSTIKVTGLSLAAISGITAAVLSGGSFAPVVVTSTLAGVSAKTILTETIYIGYTARKKKIYREKCELIMEYINKLFLFSEKCKEDKIITIDELEQFSLLVKEYREKLLGINFKHNKIDNELDAQIPGTFISLNPKSLQEQYNTLTKKDIKNVVKNVQMEELKKKVGGSTLSVVQE